MILAVLLSLVNMYLSIEKNSFYWYALLSKYIFSYYIKIYSIGWLGRDFFKGVILVSCINTCDGTFN